MLCWRKAEADPISKGCRAAPLGKAVVGILEPNGTRRPTDADFLWTVLWVYMRTFGITFAIYNRSPFLRNDATYYS